ncbi:cache domain-containing protein [Methanoregula sp.]|uniref:cache domain-containing protein n=1 Tax=Methanoregula sp. TaxID=2052170 RepID=UPI000CC95E2B|nr:cache domain-containing protein [Methanoregula sp.]PKG32600.1 MAG: histidine kinase [Methanoregula sp.]
MRRTLLPPLLVLILFTLAVAAGCAENRTLPVPATPPPTPVSPMMPSVSNETLVSFVDHAVAYAKEQGDQRALSEFSNRNGSFMQGELYIFAYGYNGTTLAHPINPEAIGKPREGANAVFVKEMAETVRNGSGFYRYVYINPRDNNILESKLGYGRQVADDWWLGSGVYTGPVNGTGTATVTSLKTL